MNSFERNFEVEENVREKPDCQSKTDATATFMLQILEL